MRKIAVITALLLATTTGAQAQYYSLGRGNRPCATWLSSPAEEAAGGNWIQGLWTGMNLGNRVGTSMNGSKTESAGILAEAKKVCLEDTSQPLVEVVMRTYMRIQEREFPERK